MKNKETKVVCIKDTDEYEVLITRPTKWGNPFSHLENSSAPYKVKTRREAVEKYKEWILQQPDLLDSLDELEGKVLGCVCKPGQACHGNVLVELIKNRHYKSLF